MTDAEIVALWTEARKLFGPDAAGAGIEALLTVLRAPEADPTERAKVEDNPRAFVLSKAGTALRADARERLLLEGLCRECGKPREDFESVHCYECREKLRKRIAEYRERRRNGGGRER